MLKVRADTQETIRHAFATTLIKRYVCHSRGANVNNYHGTGDTVVYRAFIAPGRSINSHPDMMEICYLKRTQKHGITPLYSVVQIDNEYIENLSKPIQTGSKSRK